MIRLLFVLWCCVASVGAMEVNPEKQKKLNNAAQVFGFIPKVYGDDLNWAKLPDNFKVQFLPNPNLFNSSDVSYPYTGKNVYIGDQFVVPGHFSLECDILLLEGSILADHLSIKAQKIRIVNLSKTLGDFEPDKNCSLDIGACKDIGGILYGARSVEISATDDLAILGGTVMTPGKLFMSSPRTFVSGFTINNNINYYSTILGESKESSIMNNYFYTDYWNTNRIKKLVELKKTINYIAGEMTVFDNSKYIYISN